MNSSDRPEAQTEQEENFHEKMVDRLSRLRSKLRTPSVAISIMILAMAIKFQSDNWETTYGLILDGIIPYVGIYIAVSFLIGLHRFNAQLTPDRTGGSAHE